MFWSDGNISKEFTLNRILSIRVRKLGRGLDYGATKPFLGDLCFLGHGEDDGESEAVLCEIEAAEFFAKDGWEHRDGPLDEVNAGGPLLGIAVKSGVRLYEV